MNAEKNRIEQELARTLDARAGRIDAGAAADLSLDRVVARAGEIRRGRRMRATLAMAAVVLAIAVPVGITVVGKDDSGDPGQKVATAPDRSPISLEDLKPGSAPADYADRDGLHHDGTVLPTGSAVAPTAATRIDGGFLVALPSQENRTAVFISDDGSRGQSWPLGDGGFAVSSGGAVGAFVEPDGTVIAVQDGGSRWFELGKLPGAGGRTAFLADAVVGENCSGRGDLGDACTVYATSDGPHAQVYTVGPHEEARIFYADWLGLSDVAPGNPALFAGLTGVTDEGSCSAVRQSLDGSAVATLWKTCSNTLDAFSPDGKHLTAGPAYRDGPGDATITVLDARTGRSVLDLGTVHQAVIPQVVWEDDKHLLALVVQGNRWGVLRIGLDGRRELALPVVVEADYVSPYTLVTR